MMIIDVTVLNKAWELFFRLFDKRISFTDAITNGSDAAGECRDDHHV